MSEQQKSRTHRRGIPKGGFYLKNERNGQAYAVYLTNGLLYDKLSPSRQNRQEKG